MDRIVMAFADRTVSFLAPSPGLTGAAPFSGTTPAPDPAAAAFSRLVAQDPGSQGIVLLPQGAQAGMAGSVPVMRSLVPGIDQRGPFEEADISFDTGQDDPTAALFDPVADKSAALKSAPLRGEASPAAFIPSAPAKAAASAPFSTSTAAGKAVARTERPAFATEAAADPLTAPPGDFTTLPGDESAPDLPTDDRDGEAALIVPAAVPAAVPPQPSVPSPAPVAVTTGGTADPAPLGKAVPVAPLGEDVPTEDGPALSRQATPDGTLPVARADDAVPALAKDAVSPEPGGDKPGAGGEKAVTRLPAVPSDTAAALAAMSRAPAAVREALPQERAVSSGKERDMRRAPSGVERADPGLARPLKVSDLKRQAAPATTAARPPSMTEGALNRSDTGGEAFGIRLAQALPSEGPPASGEARPAFPTGLEAATPAQQTGRAEAALMHRTGAEMPHRPADQPAAVQVGLGMAHAAANGTTRLTLRLSPQELGHVEIRMEFTADGHLKAHVLASNAEALDLLQRDARTLERALAESGIRTDSGSLSFSLNQQGNAPGGQHFADPGSGRPPMAGHAEPALKETVASDGATAESELRLSVRDGLDIRV
ncbi:MAG: hypothetical protein Tsb008_17100 [Rhodothalassiaceae bacterium]